MRYDWVHRLKQDRPRLQVVLNGGLDTVEASLATVGVKVPRGAALAAAAPLLAGEGA